VALLLLAQPLAAAAHCWQEATESARCSGDCDMHSNHAPDFGETVDAQENPCCEFSPTEPVSPAALSKALQKTKFSPDNDPQIVVEFFQTPGFIFNEQISADLPANHSRQSLLCTFRI
jgi:hypothetical protein